MVRESLGEMRLEALLVTDLNNIRYLSGFTGSSAVLLIGPDEAFFLTDSRYAGQAGGEVHRGFSVRVYRKKWLEEASGIIERLKYRAVGFEGLSLSYDASVRIRKALKKARLRNSGRPVNRVREVKDLYELGLIRDAVKVLDRGYARAEGLIRPGAVEKDAAFSIELFMRRRGADALAFDTIIASGERGALAHGKASSKAIRKGELVVVDMGVRKEGYNSDETRTVSAGSPSRRLRKIYMTVLEAQMKAIEKIAPGVKASSVDRAAREHIRKAGFGKFFGHALGHGVGLEVHEGPFIGPESSDILREGMVFTVEPGIYVPGRAGVRIEDMVLVTARGSEVLTKAPKEAFSII